MTRESYKTRTAWRSALLTACICTVAVSAEAAELGDVDSTIRIAVNEWTGQHVSAYLAGDLLNKLGYSVEYVTAGAVPQVAALAQGDLHLQPEFWDHNVGDIFPKAIAAGDIVVVNELGLKPVDGWLYPAYVEELCPGLPDYKALYDCSQVFATPDSFPRGRVIVTPAEWGMASQEMIKGLELPLQPVPGGSEGAIIAEISSAISAGKPVLSWMWEPHWIHAKYNLKWVEFPPFEEGCDTDPSVGLSPDRLNDCGLKQANISKVVNRDFAHTWPAAYTFLQHYMIDNTTQNQLIFEIDENKRPAQEVVSEWVENNSATWAAWIEAAKQ